MQKFDKKGRYQLVKGGRNQEGYADPTVTIAVGRVAKEDRLNVKQQTNVPMI